jgi:hypothetical protein
MQKFRSKVIKASAKTVKHALGLITTIVFTSIYRVNILPIYLSLNV